MKRFLNDESGVITVEWVVLGASLLFIAVALSVFILNGFTFGANTVEAGVSSTDMPSDMRALLDAAAAS